VKSALEIAIREKEIGGMKMNEIMNRILNNPEMSAPTGIRTRLLEYLLVLNI
jgi:hypothetical protein